MSFVTCKLYGRMGNQMFQIAATMGTAYKFGVEFLIPRYTGDPGRHAEELYFDHFPEFKPSVHQINRHYPENNIHNYRAIRYSRDIQLDGYWQSEKYFDFIWDEVRRWFEMRLGPWEQKDGLVGVHIRRGDYVNNPNFPTVPMSYYEYCMAYFRDLGYTRFLITSDDIPWCKDKFPGCEFSDKTDAHEDMRQLANCEHFIIANSTFSWWGAGLSRNPNKIVLSPHHRHWFGPRTGLNTVDKVPASWKQINYADTLTNAG